MLYTIKIRGWTGNFRADVIAFNRENKELLIRIMNGLGLDVERSATLKEMKEIAKNYNSDYPRGFKYIEGIFCFYHVLG